MCLMKYGYDKSMHDTGDPNNSSAIYCLKNPDNFCLHLKVYKLLKIY